VNLAQFYIANLVTLLFVSVVEEIDLLVSTANVHQVLLMTLLINVLVYLFHSLKLGIQFQEHFWVVFVQMVNMKIQQLALLFVLTAPILV